LCICWFNYWCVLRISLFLWFKNLPKLNWASVSVTWFILGCKPFEISWFDFCRPSFPSVKSPVKIRVATSSSCKAVLEFCSVLCIFLSCLTWCRIFCHLQICALLNERAFSLTKPCDVANTPLLIKDGMNLKDKTNSFC